MTNADMDKVTAGVTPAALPNCGNGNCFGYGAGIGAPGNGKLRPRQSQLNGRFVAVCDFFKNGPL